LIIHSSLSCAFHDAKLLQIMRSVTYDHLPSVNIGCMSRVVLSVVVDFRTVVLFYLSVFVYWTCVTWSFSPACIVLFDTFF